MSSARPPAASQPTSLKHTEARDRAALIDVASYDVMLDLDRGEETFGAVSTIDLVSQGGPTFLEVQPVALNSVTVNGRPVDVALLDHGRVPIETEPGENHVVVDSVMRYRHDGEGLHRAVDPADGRHYTYAMTFLDAAPSIFGCFDQPDLKAVWTLRVRTPRDWVVLGNSPATELEPGPLGAGADAAAADLPGRPGGRALPRAARRARRHPARAERPSLDRATPRPRRRRAVHPHPAVLRRAAPAVRGALPVRRLPPGLRPRVQRRAPWRAPGA